MQVALNLLSAHVGAGVVCNTALLRALAEIDEYAEYHVLLGRTQESLARSVPSRFRVHRFPFNSRRLVARIAVEQLLLPLLLWKWRIDVLYSVGNLATLLAPCATVVLMENTNPFSIFRLQWTAGQRIRNIVLRHLSRLCAKRASRVRFVSRTSRDALVLHLGISDEKTVVIPHAAGPWENGETPRDLPSRFVLTVAALAPHKNLERLLEAFALLVEERGYPGALVIAGPPLVRTTTRHVKELRDRLGLTSRIVLLGGLPHGSLGALYRRAEAFAMTSLEETFGLPVLEAMSFGVPTVVGELSPALVGACLPFKELCGDGVLYCDPLSPKSIAEALGRVLFDSTLRETLAARAVEQASVFTWEKVARALQAVFRESARERVHG